MDQSGESKNEDNVPDDSSIIGDLDELCNINFGNVKQVIRSSHALPKAGDDHEFYCSFSGFQEFLSYQKNRLLMFISMLMKNNGYKSNFAELAASALSDVDDSTDKMIECNDGLLERVAALLDSCEKGKSNDTQIDGKSSEAPQASNRNAEVVVSSWNRQKNSGHTHTFRLLHAHNIMRPQLKFKDPVDNTNTPFIPKIKVKQNALKPLANRLAKMNSAGKEKQTNIAPALANLIDSMRSSGEEDQTIFQHPYEYELNIWEPLPQQMEKVQPQMYSSLDPTSCIYIDQFNQLRELLEVLKSQKEFAVDLEHHSYRSFQGITCLLQISTRTQDYIVDTLALRSELWILNEVFTDPKIVKVLHGADSDIVWLQRDFGIYVVNMFDTGQAARLLSKERFSLEYLADQYCNVQFDKKYQLADWRIRPLPEEMSFYAQGDTHYLLYIYDLMKNELLDKANGETRLLRVALLQSRDLCLLRYDKPITTPESHIQLLEKMRRRRGGFKLRSPPQLEALRLLFLWRDGMARKEDESPGYVLPNHMLLQIAEILPKEAQGVLACCNPIPPLLRQHVLTVHQLIKDARHVLPSSSSTKHSEVETKVPVPAKTDFDSTNLLTCPHDLSQTNRTEDVATKSCNVIMQRKSDLLGPFENDISKKGVFLSKSDNTCAFTKSNSENQLSQEIRETIEKKSFWNPFALYFPSSGDKIEKVPPSNSHLDQPLTLNFMLSGNFQWKMRNLGDLNGEEEETVEEKPKTFGTKMEISDDAKRTTEEQVQVLKSMMSKKKKQNAPLTPATPVSSTLISMEGIPKALQFKPNKDHLINQKITKKFVGTQQKPQQRGSNKRPVSHENISSKRSFQPHVYSKDEYKQFRRPKDSKKKRRPGKPKRY